MNEAPEQRPLSEPVGEKHGERATPARLLCSNRCIGSEDQHRSPSAETEAESQELAWSSGSIQSQVHDFNSANKSLPELCVRGSADSLLASHRGSQPHPSWISTRGCGRQHHETRWVEAPVLEMQGGTLAVTVHFVPRSLGRVDGDSPPAHY